MLLSHRSYQQGPANALKSQSLSRNSWQRAEPGQSATFSQRQWEIVVASVMGDARLSMDISRVVG